MDTSRSNSSAHLDGPGSSPAPEAQHHQQHAHPQHPHQQHPHQQQQGQQQQHHHQQKQGQQQQHHHQQKQQGRQQQAHQQRHHCQQRHGEQELRHPLTEAGASWVRGPLVGAGAFGSVHQCLSLSSGAILAVKSCSAPPHSAQMQALEREIALTSSIAALHSPHVITYLGDSWTHEAGTGALTRNLAMEYAPGGSISALLRTFCKQGGGLPEDMVRRYTRGILLGLRDLHGMGIVHGDIKGGNILLSASGNVKIADFGASRIVRAPTTSPTTPCPTSSSPSGSTTTAAAALSGSMPVQRSADTHSSDAACQAGGVPEMRGTLCWMSPEVVRGQGGATESDIWSLGCTVIEMLTGHAPWVGEAGADADWRAVMARIGCTQDLPPLPPGTSPVCRDFLSHCLVREASQRWSAQELLQHPLVRDQAPLPCAPPVHRGCAAPTGSNASGCGGVGGGDSTRGSPVSVLSPLRSFCPSPLEESLPSCAGGTGVPHPGGMPGVYHQRQMGGQPGDSPAPGSSSTHVSVTGMLNTATVQLASPQPGVLPNQAAESGFQSGVECRVTLPRACEAHWGGIGSMSRESVPGTSLLGSPLFALCSGPPSPLLLSPLKDVAAAMGEEEGGLGGRKSFVSGVIEWRNLLPLTPSPIHHSPQNQGLTPDSDSCCSFIPIADPTSAACHQRPFPSPVQTVCGPCWTLDEVPGSHIPLAHFKLGGYSSC